MMIDQTQLISSAFPLVGGGAIEFGVGYVIKKTHETHFHRAWPVNVGTRIP